MKRMVVYISGYGRSGSTVLDLLLGNHPNILSLGEVGNIFDYYLSPTEACSCGAAFNRCEFWSRVMNRAFPKKDSKSLAGCRRLQLRVERWMSLPWLLMKKGRSEPKQQYRELNTRFFESIYQVSEKSIIVDSSKSSYPFACRALALRRLCGLEVKVIHLVRDGRGVIHSKLQGDNRKMRIGVYEKEISGPYRGLIGWNLVNCFSVLSRLFLPKGNYILIRYEDLMSRPEKVLKRLGRFIGVELTQSIEAVKESIPLTVGHLVGGNRIVDSGSIVVGRQLNGKERIPRLMQAVYYLSSWPMLAYVSVVSRQSRIEHV